MTDALENNFGVAGKHSQVTNDFAQLKANHPEIYDWYTSIPWLELSETGYQNYANRFKIPVDQFKRILHVFEKGYRENNE